MEVGRSTEQEEPPYTVRKELSNDKTPGLAVFEALNERNGFLGGGSVR